MSWLKQSPSANSLQDAPSSSSRSLSGSGISAAGNKHSQPPVTRFLACGTVYLTHLLSVPPSLLDPLHAVPSDSQSQATTTTTTTATTTTSVRAKQVTTERGGSAVNILSLLAQFNLSRRSAVECALVAPLGSDAAGRALMHELELEGIRTRFCKVHPAGVPAAFVLRSGECATSCKSCSYTITTP